MNKFTPEFFIYCNVEAQRSLFKNNSYYRWCSSNACFSENSFQTLKLFRFLQDSFVDSGKINAGSVSQAFEGRFYYRSISLHKEGFHALVQRKLEDITNKFKLIRPDLLSYLPEFRRRPSGKLGNTSQI